jgi:hypothetical protein
MKLFGMRSVTASALSLWLGVLACLLGCAKPAAALTHNPATEQAGANCPKSADDGGDSCCQHGHDSHGSSDKSSHHAMSCCPTETVLAERKSAPIAKAVAVDLAALAIPVADAYSVVFESSIAGGPTPWQAGRDILRRVHVLRI